MAIPTSGSVSRPDATGRNSAFSALIGLTTLAVFLQSLWAGIFLDRDLKRDTAHTWVDVHSGGAVVAILLALAATVVAFLRLRRRTDLWAGSAALAVLLIAESYLGNLISEESKDALTAVHVPLAMAIMALAVWLPMRARQSRAHLPGE